MKTGSLLPLVVSLGLLLAPCPRSLAQFPPVITNQPQSQTIYLSNSVTFSVGVFSTTFATYQWRFNGTNIASATSTNYTITNVFYTNAGDYSVAVTNADGWTYSSNASLTVYGPPAITTQPANTQRSQTTTGSLSVTALGTAPLSYQWRFYTTNILSGQTNSTLSFASGLEMWAQRASR